MMNPATDAMSAPKSIDMIRMAGSNDMLCSSMRDMSMPLNAPTAINPACPSDSSPEIPTTRLSDTASDIYTQIGTNCPCKLWPISPAAVRI